MTINHFLDKMPPVMSDTFKKKVAEIKKFFCGAEDQYALLIKLGRLLPIYKDEWKTPDRIVKGCQSTTYLYSRLDQNQVLFDAHSDALISAGLVALLIAVYNHERPETILKCPPDFIGELGIGANLSPGRSNGLAQIHLRMKQDAIKLLTIS